jgi:hypothetical protein
MIKGDGMSDAEFDPQLLEMKASFEQAARFRMSLIDESDRGSGLMCAQYLDDRLGELLKRSMLSDKVTSELFEPGPLGNFATKINLAYSLGLITGAVRHELHPVRKIRNEFAHSAEPIKFDEPKIQERCRELGYSFYTKDEDARRRFQNAVAAILSILYVAIQRATPPSTPSSRFTVPTKEEATEMREYAQGTAKLVLGGQLDLEHIFSAVVRLIGREGSQERSATIRDT